MNKKFTIHKSKCGIIVSNKSKHLKIQDLNNAEIMKVSLLKKITLNTLIIMNIEEKINLGLKSIVGGAEIEPFKYR